MRSNIIYISITIFLLFFSTQQVSSFEVGGLAFKSSELLINERTSAHLDLSKIKIRGSFSVCFDLSIWAPDKFGYILTYVHPSGKIINLVHVHFRQNENSQLEITIPSENKVAVITVPKKIFMKNQWSDLEIHFDTDNNIVSLSFEDNKVELETELGNETNAGQLYFGRSPQNIDVLSMAIRNIEFKQHDGTKLLHIPLIQKEGTKITDISGKIIGNVDNPSWLISEHLHWSKTSDTLCHFNSGIAYDPVRNNILIYSADSIITYALDEDVYNTSYLKNAVNVDKFYREAVFASVLDKGIVYHYGNAEIGDCIITKNKVTDVERFYHIKRSKGKKHHHGVYFNDQDSSLYFFGGYGSFSYYNNLNRFSPTDSSWEMIPLAGDTITPRFYTAMGQADNPGEVFLFGGFGNFSGKQEMGGFNLYDLFLIDLKNKTSKKLADLKSQVDENFVVLNQIVYNKKNNELYVLGFTHHQVYAKLQLYRISLDNYVITKVADTIPMMSEKIQSNAFLYFDEVNARLLCIVKEWSYENVAKLKVYSLASPPLNEAEFFNTKHNRFNFILLIVIVLFLLAVGVFVIRRQKKSRKLEQIFDVLDEPEDKSVEKSTVSFVSKPNTIYTFGGFAVFDKKGKDITYRFSVRLKNFFALLILKSYSEREGLMSQEICSVLWPDKDLSSAQNLRGVTANQLKSILSDVEGLIMEKSQSGKWVIRIEAPAYCDYVFVLTNYIKNKSVDITSILPVLDNGLFFPLIQTTWIDKFKSDFESVILSVLPQELDTLIKNLDYSNVVKATSVLLLYDPINNEFMATKLAALVKLGKMNSAKQLYEQYKTDYQNSYGNQLSVDIKQFVERHSFFKLI